MDYVSNRNGRPARQVPTSEHVPVEKPRTPQTAPTPTRSTSRTSDTSRRKKPVFIALLVVILVLLITGGYILFSKMNSTATAIDSSKYQAVFFTNGQVYFGKLKAFNSEYMKLGDVYYLQTKADADEKDAKVQSASKQDASDVELIKLGNEIHGPTDEMVISKDQVLFFENLKSEGSVSQTITNFRNKEN